MTPPMPLRKDLLTPIPGVKRAGDDLRYSSIFDQIKDARREDPFLVPAQEANWPLAIDLIEDTLATKTKDLWLVAWLAEGMLRTGGLAAFRETLDLAKNMLEGYWDNLYPPLEEENAELRGAPLQWISGRLGSAVRELPITSGGYSLNQYKQALRMGDWCEEAREPAIRDGKIPIEVFDGDVEVTGARFYAALATELAATLDALTALEIVSDEKFGYFQPSYYVLRRALEDVLEAALQLRQRKTIDAGLA